MTMLSFPTAVQGWGSPQEQLMWHLLHKLLTIVFMSGAQYLTDGASCSHCFLVRFASYCRISAGSQLHLSSTVQLEIHHI